MRPKKPTHVLIDQVRITREGSDAIIDHADANLSGVRISSGLNRVDDRCRYRRDVQRDPRALSGRSCSSGTRRSSRSRRARSRSTITRTAINGCRAATCCAASSTTVGRTGKSSSVSTTRSYRSPNSAGLLSVHAGWGMRIAFVPEEFVTENPNVKVRKPERRKR